MRWARVLRVVPDAQDLPLLQLVSATAMMQPRAGLKMRRWDWVFMGFQFARPNQHPTLANRPSAGGNPARLEEVVHIVVMRLWSHGHQVHGQARAVNLHLDAPIPTQLGLEGSEVGEKIHSDRVFVGQFGIKRLLPL